MNCLKSEPDLQPFRAGRAFRNEKLYEFDDFGVTVMRGWPEPLAWRKTRTKPWMMLRPRGWFCPRNGGGGTLRDDHDQAWEWQEKPLRSFCSSIPAEVRHIISGFAERHWHMLCFLARCGSAALDLAEANPALAFCLANNWVFHKPVATHPMRSIRRQLPQKQREIAQWLGFAGSRSAVRALRKVTPFAVTIAGMLSLRRSLANADTAKLIRHLPLIGADVMYILVRPYLLRRVSSRFLLEVATAPAEADVPHGQEGNAGPLLRDVLRMSAIVNPEAPEDQFRSVGALHRAHEELVWGMERIEADKYRDISFPPPPFLGTDTIGPVTTPAMLLEEGRLQHNCIGSYIEPVAQGECYVYRVLCPERATLCVSWQQGQWAILDIRATCNAPVSDGTAQIVRDWLTRAIRGRLPLWELALR